jgi:hypothetical protein
MNPTKNNIKKTKIEQHEHILVFSILFLVGFVLFNLNYLYIVFSEVRIEKN